MITINRERRLRAKSNRQKLLSVKNLSFCWKNSLTPPPTPKSSEILILQEGNEERILDWEEEFLGGSCSCGRARGRAIVRLCVRETNIKFLRDIASRGKCLVRSFYNFRCLRCLNNTRWYQTHEIWFHVCYLIQYECVHVIKIFVC